MDLMLLVDLPDALPVVARWYYDEWGHKITNNSYERTCARIRGKLNRDKAPLHIVAVRDGAPLGVAQLKVREMDIYPDKGHWLGSLYVAPEVRGQGVAGKLVGTVMETARSFGIDRLYLQTERHDGGLYARLGWQALEQVRYRGLDVLIMERDLQG